LRKRRKHPRDLRHSEREKIVSDKGTVEIQNKLSKNARKMPPTNACRIDEKPSGGREGRGNGRTERDPPSDKTATGNTFEGEIDEPPES